MTFEGKQTQNSCSKHANFPLQTVKVGISQKHYFLGIHCFWGKKRSALCIKVKTRTKKNKVKTCKLYFNHGSYREGGCVRGPTKTGVYSNRMRHEA